MIGQNTSTLSNTSSGTEGMPFVPGRSSMAAGFCPAGIWDRDRDCTIELDRFVYGIVSVFVVTCVGIFLVFLDFFANTVYIMY